MMRGRHRFCCASQRSPDGRNVSEEVNSPASANAPAPAAAVKEKYQKPAFRYEKVFETMALACGKITNSQASCHSNKKNS